MNSKGELCGTAAGRDWETKIGENSEFLTPFPAGASMAVRGRLTTNRFYIPKYLTDAKFEEYMANLQTDLQKFATKEDTKRELQAVENRLDQRFDDIAGNIDTYLKRTEDWYQEHIVLRHCVGRLETALVRKNILGQNDLQ